LAKKYCAALIKTCKNDNTLRLPTIREMALKAGVSHVTMMQVVLEFKKKGILRSKPGGGITILDGEGTETAGTENDMPARSMALWRKTVERIKELIRSGAWAPAQYIPDKKQLCQSFGISQPTLNKALAWLIQQHYLNRERSRYLVPPLFSSSRRGCIVFLFRGPKNLFRASLHSRMKKVYRNIEQICFANGVGFLPVPIYYDSPEQYISAQTLMLSVEKRLGNRSIIGFILWNFALPELDFSQYLKTIQRYNRPVSLLLDEIPLVHVPKSCREKQLLIIQTVDSYVAGRKVGRYLREKGYTNFTFLAFEFSTRWEQRRYRGVVEEFCGKYTEEFLQYSPDLEDSKKLNQQRPQFKLIRDLLLQTEPFTHTDLWYSSDHQVTLKTTLNDIVYHWKELDTYYPVIEKLYQQSQSCAIVGANDILALRARQILQLPQFKAFSNNDIIGFDDSDDALYYGLSSYNFNDEAFARGAVQYVLNAAAPQYRKKDQLQIEGFLNIRDT